MAAAAATTKSFPPPVPVSLRLEASAWDDLDLSMHSALRALTNGAGDTRDDGSPAGSVFRHLIDDAGLGLVPTDGWHAVTAWPDRGSRYAGPVAWALLRPESTRTCPTLRAGFYTHPAWRQRGIARLLANEAARLAHRLGYRRLVASPWNDRSAAFFAGAGFTTVCRHGGGMSGLCELDIDECPPVRLPWRCRPPEST